MDTERKTWLVGVVGPCASGKSTLIAGIQAENIMLRHIAQEHSYVADMWQRLTDPHALVFLDASYQITCSRRNLNWTEAEYAEQHRRLSHARANANFYILTDSLSPSEVQNEVLQFLQSMGFLP